MPNRRRNHSFVVGLVAAVTVASPLGALALEEQQPEIEPADNSTSTDIASILLKTVPDVVIPIKQLTGLDLPDLRLSDLTTLPGGLKLPIALPGGPGQPDVTDPSTLVNPGALPSDLYDKLGTEVKEIRRDTPFSVVALTAEQMGTGTVAQVRPQLEDGSWGEWTEAEGMGWRPQNAGAKTGTEPIYVGKTNAVQVMLTSAAKDAAAAGEALTELPQTVIEGISAGDIKPASLSKPLRTEEITATEVTADDLSAVLIDPGTLQDDENLQFEQLPNDGPKVVTRAGWGADESIRCDEPTIDDEITAGTVHHTAGRNDYSEDESAGIMRAIYRYHAQTLGWCDIGYQALVDRFGRIFEGRHGGMTRNVQGAHAGGFNENTVGVAMMGNFEEEAPPQEQIDATGKYIGWRLKLAALDPMGHQTHYSEGTSFSKYAQGEAVDLPNIFAHRDVGSTDCPGDGAYAKLDEIRTIAASAPGTAMPTLSLDQIAQALSGNPAQPAAPVDPAAPTQTDPAAPAAPVDPAAPAAPVDLTINAGAPVLDSETVGTTSDSGSAGSSDFGSSLINPTDDNVIARRWTSEGGVAGKLGPALTGLLKMQNGQSVAKFANGIIFTAAADSTTPDVTPGTEEPQTVVLLGKALETFLSMGNVKSKLGVPVEDAYPVAEGERIDFEGGSLIVNQLSGLVTTLFLN